MTFRKWNWTLERERKSGTNGSLVVVREAVLKMISKRAGAAEKDRTIIVAMGCMRLDSDGAGPRSHQREIRWTAPALTAALTETPGCSPRSSSAERVTKAVR
ncbi:hypothetical protein DNFV4_01983 [Nitrospira tepida]|uniref:Uncharacterized protein n=1 Tax=Nitrospira tepida TaxID=2973512 RepID=A0AA86MZ25_9BACT|nr:hypothetical protein DNFV4_01983 [Nitrospira tepida]